MLLKPEARTKYDNGDDGFFYSVPRFVTHVDDHFIDQLTQLYRERLKPNSRVLDLMSSWVSHLPDEVEFAHVEGHGMNEEELRKNPRLNHYVVQNLNSTPQLPFSDGEFDAVLICVSVQYLQYPEIVLSEICRLLKPGGLLIISFSNRMFYQKAIAAWRDNSEMGRVALVKAYLKAISGFTEPEVIIQRSELPSFLQMLGMGGQDPFYAVIAERKVE
ncbi:class I SAM-dependent methyltransferase [Spirulina subsalsa]|uniref:class I SAM-dependent methyltransferase n=1 Tax=Spirulina subsalsa TaxID=54311 RepID=UPI0002D36BF1|nr:class I SAM-dependent methyltransferase [Spirulina subsalsa]